MEVATAKKKSMDSLEFTQIKLLLVRERTEAYFPVCSPEEIAPALINLMGGMDREHFVLIALDSRNQPIGATVSSVGTLSASIVHPREVFAWAIMHKAASIFLAHNHPSGDPSPSEDDIALTRRLSKAGDILGITVLDHFIVCDTDFVSLKTVGCL